MRTGMRSASPDPIRDIMCQGVFLARTISNGYKRQCKGYLFSYGQGHSRKDVEGMITERDVEHIGMLADIAILREELEEFTASFNKILEYFDILDQVTGDETDEGLSVNVFRKDEVVPSLAQKEVLSNAKETEDGFFRAPRVM